MEDRREYPGRSARFPYGAIELQKIYTVRCAKGPLSCSSKLQGADDTRREFEAWARSHGWGRTSSGEWYCPEHIEELRNAGARANVGRKREQGG